MMDTVTAVAQRQKTAVSALVRFERRPIEDKPASQAKGMYIAKDVDFALITPPYSKDEQIMTVKDWMARFPQKVSAGHLTEEQVEKYKKQYEAWKNGQDMPIDGTPIKGWPVISPAQQEMLIALGIPTVERLADANAEGLTRIGMGAVDLKHKAEAWLLQAWDRGPMTMEMSALKKENENQKVEIETMKKQIAQLTSKMSDVLPELTPAQNEITAADILDEPIKRGPGRPPKGA